MDWIKWLDEEIDLIDLIYEHDHPENNTRALDFQGGKDIHLLYVEDLIEAAKQVGAGIEESECGDPDWTKFSFTYKGHLVIALAEHDDGGQNGKIQ